MFSFNVTGGRSCQLTVTVGVNGGSVLERARRPRSPARPSWTGHLLMLPRSDIY